MVEKNTLFPKQLDIQINTSTKHVILELLQNITKSFEKIEYASAVFIGLKKTIHIVNYEVLLHKLRFYEINCTCLELFKIIFQTQVNASSMKTMQGFIQAL